MRNRSEILWTGLAGLLAAVLVGTGEFLLHFDPEARYVGGFDFFKGVTEDRATIGHFLGVLGAPLYVVGAWHLKLMLQPANRLWATIAFFMMAYGLIVGAVWIGSRATAALIIRSTTMSTWPEPKSPPSPKSSCRKAKVTVMRHRCRLPAVLRSHRWRRRG